MINAKKRFEILKRDGFKCVYCGKTGKDITLEIGHIIPKSKGGTDDVDNLTTCCRECNLGKGNVELEKKEGYKDIINGCVNKAKSNFYKMWNEKGLGTIDQKTTWLLSTIAKLLVGGDHYKQYLDMPACFGWDLSQYKNGEGKWDYDYKKLDALFKTGGDYCEYVMDLTMGEMGFSEFDIEDIIEHCSNDDEWNGIKKDDLSLRLNYKLSELCGMYDLGDNYLIKKNSLFHNLLKND